MGILFVFVFVRQGFYMGKRCTSCQLVYATTKNSLHALAVPCVQKFVLHANKVPSSLLYELANDKGFLHGPPWTYTLSSPPRS